MKDQTPEMPGEPTQAEIVEKLITQACDMLSEHASSVRIFVTYQTEDGEADTAAHTEGRGNFYAQLGQIKEWADRERERARQKAIDDWENDKED